MLEHPLLNRPMICEARCRSLAMLQLFDRPMMAKLGSLLAVKVF